MTIKNSGNPLSFTEIEAEFGSGGGQRRLGKYRRDDPAFNNHGPFPEADNGQLGSRPLDDGIPTGQNSPIKFSEFYGKKLNMIIDYYSGSNQNRTGTGGGSDNNQIATWKYQNESSKVKVVGGFKTRPSGSYDSSGNTLDSSNWQGGKKVIIHVNKRIGSEQSSSGGFNGDRRRCALRTGAWPSGTDLRLDIGSSGELLGAGGDGRKGSAPSGAKPAKAGNGTSALGVQYPVHIDNNGAIRCGYGGGGGGSGGNSAPSKSSTDYGRSGGGGGGGAGFPAGDGGSAGTGAFGPPPSGNDGSAGNAASVFNEGTGGDGGNLSGGASGGNGGPGGSIDKPNGAASQGGRGQSPSRKGYGTNQPGGFGGDNGFGIIFRTQAVADASDGNTNTPGPQGGDNVNSGIV